MLGARHDAYLFDQSELDDRLHDMHVNLLNRPPGLHRPFTALADSAYPDTLYVKRVLSGNTDGAVLLSALRCPVEHSFCKLFREFPSLKSTHRNKIFARQVHFFNYFIYAFDCDCDLIRHSGPHRKICLLRSFL